MEFNHKKMYQLMGLIAFGIVLFLGLQNIHVLTGVLRTMVRFLLPFLIGCVIAFVVNVPMRAIEHTLFSERVQQKYKICRKLHRPLSLVLTLVLMVGLMMLLIFTIAPQVSNSIQTIRAALPGFFAQLTDLINDLVVRYPEITDYANNWIASLETINWTKQIRNLFDFLRNGNLLGNTVSVATSIIGGLTNTIIGIIFALYILLQKEKLALQFKKLMYANLAERHVDTALDIFRLIQRTFSNFISGQCLEAVYSRLFVFHHDVHFRIPLCSGNWNRDCIYRADSDFWRIFRLLHWRVFDFDSKSDSGSLVHHFVFGAAADRGQPDLSPCCGKFGRFAIYLGFGCGNNGRKHNGHLGYDNQYSAVFGHLCSAAPLYLS